MRASRSVSVLSIAAIGIVCAPLVGQGRALAQADKVDLPQIVVRAPAPHRHVNRHGRKLRPVRPRQVEIHPHVPLPEGVVLNGGPAATATTAGPVSGYRALTAVSATKTDTPIERIPQTIQVIPRSVIDDQAPLTQSETLRNVAGTTGLPNDFLYGGNYYKIRGFDAERYVDGLPNFNDFGDYASLVNTERLEVVKGPGGLFYQSGLGLTGGLINTISKLPTPQAHKWAGLTAGGFDLWSPWFDINQPLGGNALFRFTGDYEHSRAYTDVLDRRSYSLNPTLTFTNNDGTSLIVQGHVSRRGQQFFVGLPGAGTLDQTRLTLRPDLYVGPSDIPKSRSEIASGTVRFAHRIDAAWSLQASARYSQMKQAWRAQTYLPNEPDFGTSFLMFNAGSPWNARELSANASAVAKFAVGEIKNTLLLEADYDRVADATSIWSLYAGLVDFSNPHPSFPQYVDPIGTGTVNFNVDNINVNGGLSVQLQTTAWNRLHLLLGGRWAYVDFLGSHSFGGGGYHSVEGKLLPRFGVAYDVIRGVTPFMSYSEGLRTVAGYGGQDTPKPEEAKQIEAGVKLALPSGFAATLAAFQITRQNVVTTNPANPYNQVQAGEERSRGFDANLIWQPIPGLSLLASYGHVDARITQDAFNRVGNRLAGVPEESGRVWATYKVQDGWLRHVTVGAGFYAASSQAISLVDAFMTPGFVTFDAKVGYETKNWRIEVVGKNLFNRDYFVPYPYAQGRVAPGTPLTVFAVASVRY